MSKPPTILPIFPLTGVVLLPGNLLPLNVFELRYRNMIRDAVEGLPWIGMIQPLEPMNDNAGPPSGEPEETLRPLQAVGCAGRIVRCLRTTDQRYLVVLEGIRRFQVLEELPPIRGYRRVEADYSSFSQDARESEVGIDLSGLLDKLAEIGAEIRGRSELEALSAARQLNTLAAALPFSPLEKQALLEAADPRERLRLLEALLKMGFDPANFDAEWTSPDLN